VKTIAVGCGELVEVPGEDISGWLEALRAGIRSDQIWAEAPEVTSPVTPDATGAWRAAAVVGDVWLGGRRLSIHPPGGTAGDAAACAAAAWCEAFEAATRHGPPALHRAVAH
jgi:hypothetical protein